MATPSPELRDLSALLTTADVAVRTPLERGVLDLATDIFAEAQQLELEGDFEAAREKREWVEVHCGHILDHTVDAPQSAAWRLTAEEQQRVSQSVAGGTAPGAAFVQVTKQISPKERDARSRAAWHSIQRGKTLFRAKAVRGHCAPPVRSVRLVARPREHRRHTTRTPRGSPARPSGNDGPEPPEDVLLARHRGFVRVLGGRV